MDDVDSMIKALQIEVAALQESLKDAERRLQNLFCIRAGVCVGDIVIYHRKPGAMFKVASVDTSRNKPWVTAYLRQRNGKWGTHPHPLYGEWEIYKFTA